MKIVYSWFALIFFSSWCLVCGQDGNSAPSLRASYPSLELQATEYGAAFVQKDFERFVELTYQKYVESTGGKQKLIYVVKGTSQQFEADGVQLISWKPIDVTQILNESGSLYAVVPMTMQMNRGKQALELNDCLIGVSVDGGKQWTFVSSDCVKLNQMFPEVAEKLVLCPTDSNARPVEPPV